MCSFHVSPSSIIKPRSLWEDICLMISVFILKDVCSFCDLLLPLKSTNFVLDALMDNLFALSHFTTLSNSVCTVFEKFFYARVRMKSTCIVSIKNKRKNFTTVFNIIKVPLRRKIIDLIWNASEQHFQTSLNGVFSFLISFLVLEIFRFFKTCKLGVYDVIYSRIIDYIYKIVNISVNNEQNSFKLCMSIVIW